LMAEVIAGLGGDDAGPVLQDQSEDPTLFILHQPGGEHYSFKQQPVRIGSSSLDNDIVLEGPTIAPHHAVIHRSGFEVEVRRVDPDAAITINGVVLTGDRAVIGSGARLGLSEGAPGNLLVVEWAPQTAGITLERHGLLRKLLWLSQADMLRTAAPSALASIASIARVWRCRKGVWLCRSGDLSRELFVLASGTAEIFRQKDGGEDPAVKLGCGALVDVIGLVDGSSHRLSACITSAAAQVLTINRLQLRGLMAQDASLSLAILGAITAGSMQDDSIGLSA